MCEVDWAAWGTWAAVVVALGIAVADKVHSFFQRNRETRILAILAMNELAGTIVRLEDIEQEVMPETDTMQMYPHILANDFATRKRLSVAGENLKLPVLESVIERLPHVRGDLGTALANVLAAAQNIRVGCADPVRTPDGKTMEDAVEFYNFFKSGLAQALATTRAAVNLAGKLSK